MPSGGVGEAVITNTYAPFLHVTVTKRVTGGMGDTRRSFAFAAAIDGAAVTADTPMCSLYGGAALSADGFTLPHKGRVVIGHLKPGQTVTVTEETLTDYENDDGRRQRRHAGQQLYCDPDRRRGGDLRQQ